MAMTIADQFLLSTGLPIDSRFVFANQGSRDSLNILQRYQGLITYVVSDQKFYHLKGGVTNAHWAELGGGLSADYTPDYSVDPTFTANNAAAATVSLEGSSEGLLGVSTIRGITVLVNNSGHEIIIYNNIFTGPGSIPIITGTGKNFKFKTNTAVLLAYDGANARYRMVGGSGGSSEVIVRNIIGDDTASEDDDVILADTTSGDVMITLPDPATIAKRMTFKKLADANALVINGNGNNIDGSATIEIYNINNSVTLVSNGTEWYTV